MAKVNLGADDFLDKESLLNAITEIGDAIKILDSNMTTFAKNLDKRLKANTTTIADATKIIKDYQTAIDKIVPSSKDYTDTISKATDEINKQANAYTKANEEIKKSKKATDELDTSLNGIKNRYKSIVNEASGLDANTQAFKNLQDDAQKLDREIKNLNNGFKAQKIVAEAAAGSYDELSQRQTKLKRELKSLGGAFGENAAAAQRMKLEIQENDKKLKEFDKSIGESFRNVGNYASAFDGLSGGLLGAFQAGGAAGLGFAAVTKAVELGIEGVQKLAEEIATANKQLKETESITGLTGDSLYSLSAGIDATAKKFDLDYTEVLRAANTAAKEFGISQEDALSGIQNLLARGGNINGDALDNIREYSTQVAQAGLSYKQFLEVQTQSAKAGIFDDKLLDVIKEGQIRLGDLSKAQSDALKTLGKGGQEVTKLFSEGKRFEAIQKLSQEIIKLQENGKNAQPIISNLFGGPGEDVGKQGFKIIATLDATTQSLTKAEQATLDLLKAQTETGTKFNEFSARFSGVGNFFAIAFEKAKSSILEFANDIFDSLESIGVTFEKFLSLFDTDTLGLVGDFFKLFIDAINPFDDFAILIDATANGFKKLVATLFGISNAIKIFKIEFSDNIQAIKDFASGKISFDTLRKNLASEGESVANAFKYGYEKTLSELNTATAKVVDSGDVGTATDKAINSKANENLTTTAEKYKTNAELKKELIRLEKDLNKELDKTSAKQRPEFLEKTRSEIEKIKKQLTEKTISNFSISINDANTEAQLINTKEQLIDLAVLAEEYKQKRLQGLINEQELELALFDTEKKRIEYQLANAAALNLNEEQLAKLKTEQVELNQKIAANPVLETLKILGGQETILREQRALGLINDIQLNERLLDIEERKVQQQLANAEKLKLSQEQINQLKLTQAEIDKKQAAQAFNTPINNAAQDALLSYIDNAIAAAGITAFLNALKNGENVQFAFKEAGQAAAVAGILSVFSKRKFAKGVIGLEGAGTTTSDSIPSLLSRGESVITAKGTDNAKRALTEINMGKLTDADIFGTTKRENIQLAASKAKEETYSISKNDFAEMLQTVKKATLESVNVTNISVEVMQEYIALLQENQRGTVRTIYPNPTQPKTKIKNNGAL